MISERLATGGKFIASRGWLDIFRVAAVTPPRFICQRAALRRGSDYDPDFLQAETRFMSEGRRFKPPATKKKNPHSRMGMRIFWLRREDCLSCQVLRDQSLDQQAPCGARNFRSVGGAPAQNFDRCGNPAIPSSAPGSGMAGFKLFARPFC